MRRNGSARETVRGSLRVLGRRKRLIAFTTLAALGVALVYSVLQTPKYAAHTDVLLRGADPASQALSRGDAARAARTESEIIESGPVLTAVEEGVGFRPEVSATQLGDTDVIRIEVTSEDPGRAVEGADAVAATYAEQRTKQRADELAAAKQEQQTKLADVERRVVTAPPGPQRTELENERTALNESLEELEVNRALSASYVRIMNQAAPPTSPASPQTARNVLVGLVVGLLAGLLLTLLLEHLDDSVKSKHQLEKAVRDVPVLAVIPTIVLTTGRRQLVALQDTDSPVAEGYRKLRASLQPATRAPMQTVQITSPSSMQGKTTTAANLGVALAQAGLRVAVVDCDLRRPRVHELFGLVNSAGFTSVLAGEVPLSVALRDDPVQANLAVLPSGPLPANPSELLASRRTVEVFTSLQAAFDVVLLDTPPVLPVADAIVLSQRVDATVLVCVAEVTSRRDVAQAAQALRQVDAPLVGTVLHGAPDTSSADPETYTREIYEPREGAGRPRSDQ